ncbi:hypothetical protein [Actinokineospora sp. NPDC004072]
MRIISAAVATTIAVAIAGTPAQASTWIPVGPYPTEQSCLADKQRYHNLNPTWGCYLQGGGWYFQYNRGY